VLKGEHVQSAAGGMFKALMKEARAQEPRRRSGKGHDAREAKGNVSIARLESSPTGEGVRETGMPKRARGGREAERGKSSWIDSGASTVKTRCPYCEKGKMPQKRRQVSVLESDIRHWERKRCSKKRRYFGRPLGKQEKQKHLPDMKGKIRKTEERKEIISEGREEGEERKVETRTEEEHSPH